MPNRSEISPVAPLRPQSPARQPNLAGLLFAGSVTLVAVAAASSMALLPRDLVMPVVASALFTLATGLALIARLARKPDLHNVTCRDVAGALTLIGAFAATTIEPEQLMRLLASH